MKGLLWPAIILLFVSCNGQKGDVKIETAGIFNTPLYSIEGKDASGKTIELEDFLLTDETLPLTVKIYNSTDFNYTHLGLIFTAAENLPNSIQYAPDPEGGIKFPGYKGTCKSTLPSKQSCIINIIFTPREDRFYEEYIDLQFFNMVKPERHKATIKVLAGMPASLVFSNDETRYVFGEKVGLQEIPVIEREDALTYERELEIKNAGGIRAKVITPSIKEECYSTLTKVCPLNMDGAYSFLNSCPKQLLPQETCKLKVIYRPKNIASGDDVASDLKEIYYKAITTFAYESDSKGTKGNLNAYFNSLSTNIQAAFSGSTTQIDFESPTVVGNRESRSFQVKNNGYRSGEIHALNFLESPNNLLGKCVRVNSTNILECRKPDQTLLTLEDLPFVIRDSGDCLASEGSPKVDLQIGQVCVFDLIFQPSIKYESAFTFSNLKVELVYNSLWRGQEKILKKDLFNFSAESRTAAKIVLDKITYLSSDFLSASTQSPWTVDLGRQPLQSPNFFKRKSLQIIYKNVGQTNAIDVSIKDGRDTPIPIGSSTALGLHNPKYFTLVTASSGCALIEPGNSCTITASFAPIGFDENYKENENMFDGLMNENGKLYKSLKVFYTNGALFSDDNFTDTPNIPTQTSEARILTTLVRKGLLQELTDDTQNFDKIGLGKKTSTGDETISYLYLTNIGTGPVPYIRLERVPNLSVGHQLIPTTDPQSLSAQHDCLDLVDAPSTVIPFTTTAEARLLSGASFSSLPKEETCVFTLKRKLTQELNHLHYNPISCNDLIPTGNTVSERAYRLGNGEWEYCQNLDANLKFNWNNIKIGYYDGDFSAPGALSTTYGNRYALAAFGMGSEQYTPAKLIPSSFHPWLTATLYRPSFTLPMTSFSAAMPFTEEWFFGDGQQYYIGAPTETIPYFIKATHSKVFASTLGSFNPGSYDYVYYLGSFPKNSASITFPVTLSNFGGVTAKVNDFELVSSDPDFLTNSLPAIPSFVATNQSIDGSFTLSTTSPGEKVMSLRLEYETGEHNEPLIYKTSKNIPDNLATTTVKTREVRILVIANITDTAPLLSCESNDYEIIANDGAPPTLNLIEPAIARNLSLNTAAGTSTILLDSVKISSTPTVNDTYDLKRIKISNSGLETLQSLDFAFRSDSNSSALLTMPTSLTLHSAGTTCELGMQLNPGQSCYLTYKYQPRNADITQNNTLTFTFKSFAGEYFMQNILFSLNPRSPGLLTVNGTTAEPIAYKPTPSSSTITRSSFPHNIGTTSLTTIPQVISSTKVLKNSNSTKASLLLSYHKYLQKNSLRGYSPSIAPPTSLVPEASEYRIVSGLSYVTVFKTKYPDQTTNLEYEVSKGCLFGDDENNPAIPHYSKGFNSSTVEPCHVIMTLSMNFDYLYRVISISNGDDMRENAAELPYYSYNRSSTNSIWLHFKGTINPPSSTASGTYSAIQSTDSPKATHLSVPLLSPSSPELGDIVGIRILKGASSASLTDPYNKDITEYVDIPYHYDPTSSASFTTANTNPTVTLVNGTFYYYRAVAIRYDARFTKSSRFRSLTNGHYLSALSGSMATPVKILIPPLNHHYMHTEKLIVDKNLTGGVLAEKYTNSSSRCTTRNITLKDNGANVNRAYTLITLDTFDKISSIPSATLYSNMLGIPHWLSNPKVSIDTMCSSLPGFLPGQSSQVLVSSEVFYIRNSSNPSATVNIAVGGIPQTSYQDFVSYVTGDINFASARCQATLP